MTLNYKEWVRQELEALLKEKEEFPDLFQDVMKDRSQYPFPTKPARREGFPLKKAGRHEGFPLKKKAERVTLGVNNAAKSDEPRRFRERRNLTTEKLEGTE